MNMNTSDTSSNVSAGLWYNPPPPGIDEDINIDNITTRNDIDSDPYARHPDYTKHKHRSSSKDYDRDLERFRDRDKDIDRTKTKDKDKERDRRKHRTRSRSRSRDRRRRRSHSRSKRRKHRSRSRSRHRRHYSRSSSESSYERRKRRRRRSRSRTKSRSRSRDKHHKRYEKTESPPKVEDVEEEEEEDEPETKENAFKNDGSFLEMFKKMQEEKQKEMLKATAADSGVASGLTGANGLGTGSNVKVMPAFGKRRGGKVLKTGIVEKRSNVKEDDVGSAQDPWSIYLKEVKKYKEACCDDDSKTRPLVK